MRTRAPWLLCALVAAVCGCDERPTPPLSLAFDADAAAEDVATVAGAAEDWNTSLGSRVFYLANAEEELDCDHVRVHFVEDMPAGHDAAIGLFEQVGCHYEISILRAVAHDRANATHELGHALELGHSDDRDSVMYPETRRRAVIREEEVAQVRARWQL